LKKRKNIDFIKTTFIYKIMLWRSIVLPLPLGPKTILLIGSFAHWVYWDWLLVYSFNFIGWTFVKYIYMRLINRPQASIIKHICVYSRLKRDWIAFKRTIIWTHLDQDIFSEIIFGDKVRGFIICRSGQ
jgi:hypothetical protein